MTEFKDRLPIGRAEFDTWAESILTEYGIPNNDSTKFALATSIMHADPKQAVDSRHHFGLILLKGAANQVAYAVMQELKEKQEKEKQQAEATANAAAAEASNEQPKT